MSAHGQLSQLASDRERVHGVRPRAYWRRQRGVRHALEDAAKREALDADAAQLELGLSDHPCGRVSVEPVPPIQVADSRPHTNPRPSLADCAARPWEVFD
jgi:hypothetical protein